MKSKGRRREEVRSAVAFRRILEALFGQTNDTKDNQREFWGFFLKKIL